MAASGRPAGHSGNLSKKTIFQNDEDGLMSRLWELKKEKDELEAEIDEVKVEVDGWLEILSCTTVTEMDVLIDNFSANPSILPACTLLTSPTDLRRLAKYNELVTQLDVFELLDCSKAYTTRDGELFIKFPWRPPCKANYECCILLKPEQEHTYSVTSHNLPPTMPTESLAKKYLETPRHKAEGLRKFVSVLGQYTKAYYSRLQQIMTLEEAHILSNTAINHNIGATKLNFLVDPRLKAYPTLLVEFVLDFDPLDILPETVTAKPLCLGHKERVPPRLTVEVEDVAERMKTTSFPLVLFDLYKTSSKSSSMEVTGLSTTPSGEAQDSQTPHTPAADSDSEEESLAPLFDIGE